MTATATKQRAQLEVTYLRALERAKKEYRVLEGAIYALPAPGSGELNDTHILAMIRLANNFRKLQ